MKTAGILSCGLLLAGIAGCSSQEGTTPTAAASGPCAGMLDTCLSRQLACTVDNGVGQCVACPEGQYAALDGQCSDIGGTPLSHDFSEFTTQPGQEVLGLCQSWTIDNPDEIWVNAVELAQDVASHHSNWTFVPNDRFAGPDGVWPCQDRNYSQLTAALAGGVIYAQSTQAPKEIQRFPDGVAVRIPPYSRIIGDVHLLNTTSSPITGHVKMTLYSRPLSEVTVKLVPFHLTYDGLDIPPHSTSRFAGDCSLQKSFQATTGSPFDMDIYYILPHYHALGTRFMLDIVGGPDHGKSLFDVQGFDSEPHGRAYDPPIQLSGATGLHFGCEFVNPRDESVGWGFGDQEMCEMLGFADSKAAFESRIGTAEPMEPDGQVQQFTGACNTITFVWDHNKPGGPGPAN